MLLQALILCIRSDSCLGSAMQRASNRHHRDDKEQQLNNRLFALLLPPVAHQTKASIPQTQECIKEKENEQNQLSRVLQQSADSSSFRAAAAAKSQTIRQHLNRCCFLLMSVQCHTSHSHKKQTQIKAQSLAVVFFLPTVECCDKLSL